MEDKSSPNFRKGESIFLLVVITTLIVSLFILANRIILDNSDPTPTPTVTLTRTPRFSSTPSAIPTRTFTPTFTSTITFTPTRTATITFTPTQTYTPSNTPTTFVFDQGVFEREFVINQVIPGIINRMLVADDGTFWFASPYAAGKFDSFTSKFSQVNLRDPIIGLTSDGKAWLLPPSGTPLQYWDGNQFTSYDQTNSWLPPQGYGSPSPLEAAFSTDYQGNLWMTTDYDVRRLRGDQWQIFLPQLMGFELPNIKLESTSYLLANSKVSELTWVGTCNWKDNERLDGDGVRVFIGNTWLTVDLPAASGCVTAMATSADGYLWVGMDDRLWRYSEQRDQWQEFTPPALDPDLYEGFSHGAVLDITIAPNDSVWILYELCGAAGCQTRQVRYRIHNGLWAPIRDSSQISPPLILFDQESTVWSFESNQISWLKGSIFEPVAWIDWLEATTDKDGTVWVLSGELNARMILWKYP